MSGKPWTDKENDLIVADYFAMLVDDIAGRAYIKAEHRRKLIPQLTKRSDPSIEYKHRNISAVLKALGEDSITGYKPAFNYQTSLEDAVARWLESHPEWFEPTSIDTLPMEAEGTHEISLGVPPTLSNQPPPQELEKALGIAHKFDVAGRDERNRCLGRAGEERVLLHERAALKAAGKDTLASQVRWVSQKDGDGAGYDIASFTPNGCPRLIEVKTTNGWERTPFYISRNELAVAKAQKDNWYLFRLWNFRREPKAFELRPPLDDHVSLTAMSFEASIR